MQVSNINYIKKLLLVALFIFCKITSHCKVITTTDFATKIFIDLEWEEFLMGECGAGKNTFKNIQKLSEGLINSEQLYEFKPDFIIGREGIFRKDRLGTEKELKKIGITPLIFYSSGNDSNLENFYQDLEKIGIVLNKKNDIDALITELKFQYELLPNKEKSQNAIFISSVSSTIGVVGRGVILNDLLKKTDIKNVIQEHKNYFKISWEDLLDKEIDVIFILSQNFEDAKNKYHTLKQQELLNKTKAIANDNVYFLEYSKVAPDINFIKTIDSLNNNTLLKLY